MSKAKFPRIGLSCCYFHKDPKRAIFKGKALLYMEESMSHWLTREKVITYLIPSFSPESALTIKDWVNDLDGLVLQGGSDVSPKSYGEEALREEWNGDYVRDVYETELIKEFLNADKPILGICRGAQVINVAMGGTLYQDINTQKPDTLVHRNWEIYDQNFHTISIDSKQKLSSLYNGITSAKVNSVHHQAVKDLGKNLVVEATSDADGIVEAIRYTGNQYMFGVQWHPEFQNPEDKSILDTKPILNDFLEAVRNRM